MDYTTAEMMAVAAARALQNDDVCFVGIGMPSLRSATTVVDRIEQLQATTTVSTAPPRRLTSTAAMSHDLRIGTVYGETPPLSHTEPIPRSMAPCLSCRRGGGRTDRAANPSSLKMYNSP